jgi:nucleotide-binding universal stress UspA family protein
VSAPVDEPQPRTIVAGFDGSDHAADALALARLLAGLEDAKLVVACAYPEDPLGESAAALEVARAVRGEAEETLAKARAQLGDDVETTDLRAVAGATPARVLHDLAETLAADLIVVGATHHGWAGRLLAGSTPERVLDESPCAVAVAPNGFAGRAAGAPERIAIAYDGSAEALHALDHAAALARASGARLRIVTVVNEAIGVYPPLDPGGAEEIAGAVRDDAGERLALIRGHFPDLAIETAVLEGEAAPELALESNREDVLFVGSRASGPFRRVLLGSVASKLLHDAQCPLVVVPRGNGERTSPR